MSIRLSFVTSVVTPSGDATSQHKYYPRIMRKTLRLPTAPRSRSVHTTLTDRICNERLAPHASSEFLVNNMQIDPDYGDDEFGDIDNEFDGLTIVEPMNEAELFEFCTGYNIL